MGWSLPMKKYVRPPYQTTPCSEILILWQDIILLNGFNCVLMVFQKSCLEGMSKKPNLTNNNPTGREVATEKSQPLAGCLFFQWQALVVQLGGLPSGGVFLTRTWHYDRWLSANHYHDNFSCPKHPPATSQPASAPTFWASALASKQLMFTDIPRKPRRNEGVAPEKKGIWF